jgi:hypothetical protein
MFGACGSGGNGGAGGSAGGTGKLDGGSGGSSGNTLDASVPDGSIQSEVGAAGGNGGAGGSAGGTGKLDGGSGGSSGSTLDANVPSGGSGDSTRDAGSADAGSNVGSTDTVAINVTGLGSAGFNYTQGSYLVGFVFRANTAISITQFGYYDSNLTGGVETFQSHAVGLYDLSTNTLLGSATVQPSDPVTGLFHYVSLTNPIALNMTDTYAIVGITGTNNYLVGTTASEEPVNTAITYVSGAGYGPSNSDATMTSILVEPNAFDAGNIFGQPGPANGLTDFGPNFMFTTGSGSDGGAKDTGTSTGASDPYFSNVVLLMHFDGANGATSFTDVKGHAVTPHGSAALSSTTSAVGGGSGHFDGSSAWLSLAYSDDWNFYAGDFTVESFVNFTGGVAGQTLSPVFSQFWDGPNSHGWWQLGYDRANPGNDLIPGTLEFTFSLTGSDEVPPAATWTPAANTWYHVASVRHGSDFLFFVNGALIGSQSLGASGGPVDWTQESSGTWVAGNAVAADASIQSKSSTTDFATPLSIGVGVGSDSVPNPWTYFNGYMDEVRITKGVARYTANFTPPTGPFPDN